MNRFVVPETRVLTLANGDTLVVKNRLNRGEQAEIFGHMRNAPPNEVGLSATLAYLIDWQLQGCEQSLLGLSWADKAPILNGLDPDDFNEIRDAIDAHVERVQLERAAAKKVKAGETPSQATSSSPGSSTAASTTSGV